MRLELYRTSTAMRPEQKLSFFQRRPVKRTLVATAMTAIISAGTAGVLWRGAIYDGFINASVTSGLRLEEIKIKGRTNTDQVALADAISTPWYSPMLTLDIKRIHDDVKCARMGAFCRCSPRIPVNIGHQAGRKQGSCFVPA